MSKDKFVFYRNFFDSIPEELRKDFCYALADYVFNDKKPENPMLKMMIDLIKPSLDRNLGGAPKGNQNAKKEKTTVDSTVVLDVDSSVNSTLKTTNINIKDKDININKNINIKNNNLNIKEKINKKEILPEDPYYFDGEIIKLNKKDYDTWKERFNYIYKFNEILEYRDKWLAQNQHDDWFISTERFLNKKNEEEKIAVKEKARKEVAIMFGEKY